MLVSNRKSFKNKNCKALNLADFLIKSNDFLQIVLNVPENQQSLMLDTIDELAYKPSIVVINKKKFFSTCRSIDPDFLPWVDASLEIFDKIQ